MKNLKEDIMKYWNAYNTPEEVLEIVNYIISHPSVKWEPLVYAIWGEAEIKISKYSKTIVLKLLVAERQLLLMKTAWFMYLRSDSHQRAIKLRFLTSKPGQNNSNVTSCSNLRPSASFLSTRKSVVVTADLILLSKLLFSISNELINRLSEFLCPTIVVVLSFSDKQAFSYVFV